MSRSGAQTSASAASRPQEPRNLRLRCTDTSLACPLAGIFGGGLPPTLVDLAIGKAVVDGIDLANQPTASPQSAVGCAGTGRRP